MLRWLRRAASAAAATLLALLLLFHSCCRFAADVADEQVEEDHQGRIRPLLTVDLYI